MSEPTTAELIAWCERAVSDTKMAMRSPRCTEGMKASFANDIAMLRAIAERLRQATGKAEPPPTWEKP